MCRPMSPVRWSLGCHPPIPVVRQAHTSQHHEGSAWEGLVRSCRRVSVTGLDERLAERAGQGEAAAVRHCATGRTVNSTRHLLGRRPRQMPHCESAKTTLVSAFARLRANRCILRLVFGTSITSNVTDVHPLKLIARERRPSMRCG